MLVTIVFPLAVLLIVAIVLVIVSDSKKRGENKISDNKVSINSIVSLIMGVLAVAFAIFSVVHRCMNDDATFKVVLFILYAFVIVGLLQGYVGFRKDKSVTSTIGKIINIIVLVPLILVTLVYWMH